MKPFSHIGILGTGLIGGSIGMALHRMSSPPHIYGFDLNPEVCDRAHQRRAVDEIVNAVDGFGVCELIFVAVPIDQMSDVLQRLNQLFPEILLIEVGSVKRPIAEHLHEFRQAKHVILSHPMAGKESGGIENADAELFRGASWLICEHNQMDRDAVSRVETLIHELGAIPSRIPWEQHDVEIARTSHLPQLLATLLAAYIEKQKKVHPSLDKLTGPGLTAMTRLAGSSYELWQPIIKYNRKEILTALNEFMQLSASLGDLRDGDALSALFKQAQRYYVRRPES